jgi:cold shock CspA family protein
MQGKIRFISPPPKTFGFIAPKGSTQREENVYFHAAMLVGTQFRDLFVGQHVTAV